MFGDGALTFREFMTREPLPLAHIQEAVLGFLRGRKDAALFGAQAVNAYVEEPRLTQDVGILSTRAAELANELRGHLAERFRIAARVRDLGAGRGFRLFQVRKPKNRHLAAVRPVATLPPAQRLAGVLVLAPPDLVAMKVIAYHARRGQPKSGTDWRDLAALLLAFPDLKRESGAVSERLRALKAAPDVLAVWRGLASQQLRPEDADEESPMASRWRR